MYKVTQKYVLQLFFGVLMGASSEIQDLLLLEEVTFQSRDRGVGGGGGHVPPPTHPIFLKL